MVKSFENIDKWMSVITLFINSSNELDHSNLILFWVLHSLKSKQFNLTLLKRIYKHNLKFGPIVLMNTQDQFEDASFDVNWAC